MPNLIKNVAGIADLEIHDELIAVDYVSDRAVIVNGLEIILKIYLFQFQLQGCRVGLLSPIGSKIDFWGDPNF